VSSVEILAADRQCMVGGEETADENYKDGVEGQSVPPNKRMKPTC